VSADDFEPVTGLPEPLPPGERLIWQGSPDWRALARRAFHWRMVCAYFAAIAAFRIVVGLASGDPASSLVGPLVALGCVAAVAAALLVGLAVITARSTVYTITDKRVVLRIGVALTIILNLPFRRIDAAAVTLHGDGTGDISLTTEKGTRLAFLSLWPHARPWRLGRPEPTLRCIPEAALVARRLSEALGASAEDATVRVPAAIAAARPAPQTGPAVGAALAT